MYKGSKTLGITKPCTGSHSITITIRLKPINYLVKYLLNSPILSENHIYVKNYEYLDSLALYFYMNTLMVQKDA